MVLLGRTHLLISIFLIIGLIGISGCTDDDGILIPAQFPTDSEVFIDEFGSSVTFQAFLGSKLDGVQVAQSGGYQNSRTLIITVPDVGDTSGSYAGGAFTANIARDLSGYNALTFYAKASTSISLNVAGIGNDNTGTSKFTAEVNNLPVSTSWAKYVIPIPLAEKLTVEQGLFYFAEGPEGGSGFQLWFDEVKFETLGSISVTNPVIPTETEDIEEGDTISVGGATVIFDVDGSPVTVSAMQAYYTFMSSDTNVVAIDSNGTITGVGVGTATLTAKLGSTDASGTITVNVSGPAAEPSTSAPAPTTPPGDVISLYSNAYSDVTIDSWSAEWDDADVYDETIGSDDVKKYENLVFAGVDFGSSTINATSMTRFHMDIWTPNATAAPATFKIKLVDFGANGVSDYPAVGDDVEHEMTFTENTSPGLATGQWISIDVPMTAFSGLLARAHLAQLIISGDLSIVYVDNVYFYDAGVQSEPTTPAPTPSEDPGDVISLFSDVYTDVTVDTWSAVWDVATVEDFAIGSDNVKKYTGFLVAGIETRTAPIDATAMTHFHLDVWTPDPTASPSEFKVKLVDFGANGVSGGGDDVEHEIKFGSGTMSTGIWVSLDISLSEFTNLTTRGHISQIIISGDPDTVYIDNMYFYDSGIPLAPPTAAPTPTYPTDNVISLFSDAYTDVPVDSWSTVWDSADVQDYVIESDTSKKYTNLLFAGIEFASTTVDASTMTHFHMDVWTPDATNSPAIFKIKLVDFGANGTWDDGGADDVEHEITLDETTMNTGTWVSIDVLLSDFINLTTRGHLAQLVISGDPNTVFVDNVYFHQ